MEVARQVHYVIVCSCADCPVRVLVNRDPEIAPQRSDPGTRIKPAVENVKADLNPRNTAFSISALKILSDYVLSSELTLPCIQSICGNTKLSRDEHVQKPSSKKA
jgi:hypothetical protein